MVQTNAHSNRKRLVLFDASRTGGYTRHGVAVVRRVVKCFKALECLGAVNRFASTSGKHCSQFWSGKVYRIIFIVEMYKPKHTAKQSRSR